LFEIILSRCLIAGFPWRVTCFGTTTLNLILPMDTIRLKFPHPLPRNSLFFSERITKKELHLEHIVGSRHVWTNNKWRNEQIKKGLYLPKYWIEEDFLKPENTFFYVETSVAKIIFKENLSAPESKHLQIFVKQIVDFCHQIGIDIFTEQILNSIPTLLAIGNNIPLTRLCSCNLALKVLAPFDYKPHTEHRIIHFNDYLGGGKELYFNIKKTETVKFYDKKRDIINRAETNKERALAEEMKKSNCALEILRFELTLKTGRKISEKFASLLKGRVATLQNLFNKEMWDVLLKNEIDKILNHPLQNFIFLSIEQKPFLDAFLNKNFKQIQIRNNVRKLIEDLQELGLAKTRQFYLKEFKSRQTWYNYQNRLKKLSRWIDYREIATLDSFKIHQYILKQFGIDNTQQANLDLIFKTPVSKKIDA